MSDLVKIYYKINQSNLLLIESNKYMYLKKD